MLHFHVTVHHHEYGRLSLFYSFQTSFDKPCWGLAMYFDHSYFRFCCKVSIQQVFEVCFSYVQKQNVTYMHEPTTSRDRPWTMRGNKILFLHKNIWICFW